MKQTSNTFREYVRIIWAIAAKDIVEAVKNKNTLTVLISVLFIVGFYRVMPALTNEDDAPCILLYDAGDSRLATMLDNSDAVTLYSYPSEEKLYEYLGRGSVPELGLVIPADFDQAVVNGDPLALEGYVMYWVGKDDAAELEQFAKAHIAELLDAPVDIRTAGNTVYMQPDSQGGAMAILGIIFVTIMIGIVMVPHLVIEEKKTKTMDALLISPAGPFEIAMGKAVSGLFYGMLAIAVALALNSYLIRQWWMVVAAALFGSLFTIALGLLIGTFVETRQQLTIFAFPLIMLMFMPPALMMLGDLIPKWVIEICRWVPSSALFRLLRISFSNQSGFALYGSQFALLLGSIIVAFALVVWRLRQADR
ncbi:MAG TPA: ABC transporter permease [Thermoflexia bacterium]|nr:ABC transporter permease [Thermoflexia bacterium]